MILDNWPQVLQKSMNCRRVMLQTSRTTFSLSRTPHSKSLQTNTSLGSISTQTDLPTPRIMMDAEIQTEEATVSRSPSLYFVLTLSSFLHEYSLSDPAQANSPLFSLFLRGALCTLGPAAGVSVKSHKFHIGGRKDSAGWIKTRSVRIGHPGQHMWSFCAHLHKDYDGVV